MSFLQLRAPRLLAVFVTSLGLVAAIAAPLAVAAPTERVLTSTYRVFGTTEAEVRASLDARRPGEYDARTQWFADWSFTTAMRNSRCVVATSKVHTRINFTFPAWTAPASTTEELRADWTRYLGRLRVHEAGHATNGRLTSKRIAASLATTTSTTCATLDRALRRTIAKHVAAGNAADQAYDRRTRHGETQGAIFPS